MATEEPSGQWGQPHLTLGQWWLVAWPNWVGLSVWKLSLPQDLEDDAQLSDRGEEVGVPCPAEPALAQRHLALVSWPPRNLAHPQHTKLCDLLCLRGHTTPRIEKLRQKG